MNAQTPIRSMPELLDAIRARRDELNISHETIDNIAGLQSGYTSKLLAPQPIKNIGVMSLPALLGALGIGLLVVEDTEQKARVQGRWQRRKRPQKLPSLSMALSITDQIAETPEKRAQLELKQRMSELGKRGGKRRLKTMSKRARQRAATHAARMRWSKRSGAHAT